MREDSRASRPPNDHPFVRHNLPNRSKSSRLGHVVRFTSHTGGPWGEPRGFDHGLEIHPGFNQKLSLAKVSDFHRLELKTMRKWLDGF